MKFKVSKTSVYGNDEQPCKDSFKEKCGNVWSEVLNMEQYGFLKAKRKI